MMAPRPRSERSSTDRRCRRSTQTPTKRPNKRNGKVPAAPSNPISAGPALRNPIAMSGTARPVNWSPTREIDWPSQRSKKSRCRQSVGAAAMVNRPHRSFAYVRSPAGRRTTSPEKRKSSYRSAAFRAGRSDGQDLPRYREHRRDPRSRVVGRPRRRHDEPDARREDGPQMVRGDPGHPRPRRRPDQPRGHDDPGGRDDQAGPSAREAPRERRREDPDD